jgi:protein translocase SecG subunit
MNAIEVFWFFTVIIIIITILSTDPKSSISGAQNNQLTMLFSNASEGQTFIRKFTWLAVILFFILTVLISYFN